ncbi:hypothetical protein DVH24_042297 [Malus domestica]|uniref:Uncharacterized protein n=1 Tax=Malus domestica TaxID=3750 RepID=A0A498IYP3_MALDO|nr:hypothetical protein DVH24_042297 [Malus domestica]
MTLPSRRTPQITYKGKARPPPFLRFHGRMSNQATLTYACVYSVKMLLNMLSGLKKMRMGLSRISNPKKEKDNLELVTSSGAFLNWLRMITHYLRVGIPLYGLVFCKVYENHLNAENLLYSRSPGNAALHDTRDRHLHPYVLSAIYRKIMSIFPSLETTRSQSGIQTLCSLHFVEIGKRNKVKYELDKKTGLIVVRFFFFFTYRLQSNFC